MKSISVIVPSYNEKPSLPQLCDELVLELSSYGRIFEIIFVDDGSTDGSFQVLRQLHEKDPRIRVIRLRRNFGKSAALAAGFQAAEGELVVTIDADLQDRPAEMHKLLTRLEEGYDLVSGWKRPRRDPWRKRLSSRIFNLLTSLLTGVQLHDLNCGFKAYRRQVIQEITVYGEMHRFIPVLASYRGFRVGEIPVEHDVRRHGKSKYGPSRSLGSFFDLLTVVMLTRYNSKPLHLFGILGMFLLLLGFLMEAYLTVGWFQGQWIEDRPAFMLGILLLIIGVQFIFFGLLAEMIAYPARRQEDYSISQLLTTGQEPEAVIDRAGRAKDELEAKVSYLD